MGQAFCSIYENSYAVFCLGHFDMVVLVIVDGFAHACFLDSIACEIEQADGIALAKLEGVCAVRVRTLCRKEQVDQASFIFDICLQFIGLGRKLVLGHIGVVCRIVGNTQHLVINQPVAICHKWADISLKIILIYMDSKFLFQGRVCLGRCRDLGTSLFSA